MRPRAGRKRPQASAWPFPSDAGILIPPYGVALGTGSPVFQALTAGTMIVVSQDAPVDPLLD